MFAALIDPKSVIDASAYSTLCVRAGSFKEKGRACIYIYKHCGRVVEREMFFFVVCFFLLRGDGLGTNPAPLLSSTRDGREKKMRRTF